MGPVKGSRFRNVEIQLRGEGQAGNWQVLLKALKNAPLGYRKEKAFVERGAAGNAKLSYRFHMQEGDGGSQALMWGVGTKEPRRMDFTDSPAADTYQSANSSKALVWEPYCGGQNRHV